jgi:hypothetical protein
MHDSSGVGSPPEPPVPLEVAPPLPDAVVSLLLQA